MSNPYHQQECDYDIPCFKTIPQDSMICLKYNNQINPTLWEHFTSMKVNDTSSLSSFILYTIKNLPLVLSQAKRKTLSSSNSHVSHSSLYLSPSLRSLMSSEMFRCLRPSTLCINISARDDLPVPGVPVIRMFGATLICFAGNFRAFSKFHGKSKS